MGRRNPRVTPLRSALSRADQLRFHRWEDGRAQLTKRLVELRAPRCAHLQLHALIELQKRGARLTRVYAGAPKCATAGGQSSRSVFRANPHLVRAGLVELAPGGGRLAGCSRDHLRGCANDYRLRPPAELGRLELHLVPDQPPPAPLERPTASAAAPGRPKFGDLMRQLPPPSHAPRDGP